MPNKNSILLLQLKPKDREIAFGHLCLLGVTTWEEIQRGHQLELRVQIPDQLSPSALLKSIQARETSIKNPVFLSKSIEKIQDESWKNQYQKYLKPFTLPSPKGLKKTFTVDPREKDPKVLKENTLYIQAQLAFGTGKHPSTQLGALLLQEWLLENPGKSLLDVGCGTGILAMVGKKSGAGLVWAVDNDATALKIARQNFKMNHISGIILKNSISLVRKKFSLVIANIIASRLIDLKSSIIRGLRKDGTLILSGMTYGDVQDVKKAYKILQMSQRVNQKGWSALEFHPKK